MSSTLARLLSHRSFQIFFLIAFYLAISPFLSPIIHQALYAISLFIKDILLWMLPFTVTFFIAHALSSFERKAPLFLLSLFLFEGLSNLASVWYTYGVGHLALDHLPFLKSQSMDDSFSALFRLPLTRPAWWSANKGTCAGVILGIFAAFGFPALKKGIQLGKKSADWLLTRVFSRLIPLFILGFVVRMQQTHFFDQVSSHSFAFLIWLILALLIYILFLFLLGSGPSPSPVLKAIKNLLPATGVAFSSGCSLSTMPWTIEGTAKNLQNPEFARAVIPASTNIQQIGDCIAQAFLCFLIYSYFNGHPPDIATWLAFTLPFVLARFATAAILGGAIFLMLPIYESTLGFTAEMTAILLAFNALLDPLITCSNVVANGALCRLFEKVWLSIQPKPLKSENVS